MMKPACELALFIVGSILILAQLCPIVRQVVRVLSFVLFKGFIFILGNQMAI